MTFARGERVYFDLDSGSIEPTEGTKNERPLPASAAFVGDILERASSTANPPAAPSFKPNTTGFPAHKKRANRVSAFKQQRGGRDNVKFTSQEQDAPKAKTSRSDLVDEDERARIDQENNQRLAEMSPEEIEQERDELLSSLSPSLIQRLLGRANIADGSNEQDLGLEQPVPAPPTDDAETEPKQKSSTTKKVSFEAPEAASSDPTSDPSSSSTIDAESPSEADPDTPEQPIQPPSSVHFPKPPKAPDLDPNSSSFLDDLHEKYFPDLPYNPSSLSWMTPIDPSDTTSPYHPSQTALNASELRFDFKGALLAPSKAREIPVTEGLHHHADAPEAAGYTIPELARLARSAVAAQRCVAYQILGRILYRLGIGEFGDEKERTNVEGPVKVAIDPNQAEENEVANEDEAGSFMATGLWNCIEEGKVVETLTEEAAREKGHLTAKTYAQEALWNWRRGGGRKRKAV